MEAAELDVALEELETRLERLRALYEQYFMGIEKIEPSIARKDVDRRIYVLRREKIRNTAKRFKLQTIIQRYNTFQQYWQRICREIENGTYKRHLLKAQRKGELLTIAARKRLGRLSSAPPPGASQPPAAASQPPAVASQPPSAPPLAALAAAPAALPLPILAVAPPPAAAAPLARPLGSPPLPKRPPLPARPDAAAAVAPPTPAPTPPAAAAPRTPAPVAAKPTPAAPKPAAPKFESLDLDMDFMGDWDPGAGRKPAAPAAPTKPAIPAKPAIPPKAAPPPPAASAARPASIPPAPVAAPPRPASSRPPTAPARPPIAQVPAAAQRPPVERPPAAKPALAPAAAAPKPAPAAAPAPKPAPAAASTGGGVDEARLRDLHSKLQQAKQQTKEANVSYEGLAKSIRATEAKLREQHKNRKIDFDVVIKDGRAVVKPIVK